MQKETVKFISRYAHLLLLLLRGFFCGVLIMLIESTILMTYKFPTIRTDIIHYKMSLASICDDFPPTINIASAKCVSVSSVIDGTSSKFTGLFHGHIPLITLIQHTQSVGRTRTNRKLLTFQSRAFTIHIIDVWSFLVPTHNHSALDNNYQCARTTNREASNLP